MDLTEAVAVGENAEVLRRGRSPDAIDLAVGLRLKAFRAARDLSLSELGRLVGLSYQQVQKYENGINRLSISTLCSMAAALEVAPSDLLPTAEAEKESAIGPVALELALQAARLPEPTQTYLLELVRSVLEIEGRSTAR